MGDTCVWDAAWTNTTVDNTGASNPAKQATNAATLNPQALLLATADGGVVRTLDNGRSWQRVSEGWGGTTGLDSEGTALVTDPGSGCVYAAHSLQNTGPCSVFKSCDAGTSWELLGGYTGATDGVGGLKIAGRISHLAVDFSSPVSERRLLAGGGLKSGAVWLFDPMSAAPQPRWLCVLNTTGQIAYAAQGQ